MDWYSKSTEPEVDSRHMQQPPEHASIDAMNVDHSEFKVVDKEEDTIHIQGNIVLSGTIKSFCDPAPDLSPEDCIKYTLEEDTPDIVRDLVEYETSPVEWNDYDSKNVKATFVEFSQVDDNTYKTTVSLDITASATYDPNKYY
jgi:hypothetical protein